MRIWFIHPQYFDKKGILAQWNEGLILRNIIYGSRNPITEQKNALLKSKKNASKSKAAVKDSKPVSEKTRSKSKLTKKELKEISEKEDKLETNVTLDTTANTIKTNKSKISNVSNLTKPKPISKGWVNHPFSKRVTRYHPELQKKIINTYLNDLKNFGAEFYGINFNEGYLDKENIEPNLKIPILIEHVKKDEEDALFKMNERDSEIYDFVKTVKKPSDFGLLKPYFVVDDIKTYMDSLSEEYLEWSENDINKLIGTEMVYSDEQLEEIEKYYKFDKVIKNYKQKTFNESDFIDKKMSEIVVKVLRKKPEIKEKTKSKAKAKVKNEDDDKEKTSKSKTKSKAKSTANKSKVENKEKVKNNIKVIKEVSEETNDSDYTDDDIVSPIVKPNSNKTSKLNKKEALLYDVEEIHKALHRKRAASKSSKTTTSTGIGKKSKKH